MNLPFPYQIGYAIGNNEGLTRTGTAKDKLRPLAVHYGQFLLEIQVLQ